MGKQGSLQCIPLQNSRARESSLDSAWLGEMAPSTRVVPAGIPLLPAPLPSIPVPGSGQQALPQRPQQSSAFTYRRLLACSPYLSCLLLPSSRTLVSCGASAAGEPGKGSFITSTVFTVQENAVEEGWSECQGESVCSLHLTHK